MTSLSRDEESPHTFQLLRTLGLREASALVVGTIIGTGVFLKTAVMAQHTGSIFWLLMAWLVSGLLSICGALVYAELGARFPRAGGEYVYLHEAYGSAPAFLYGWQRFWISSPGTIAAYAVGAAMFLNGLLPLDEPWMRHAVALGIIIFFTVLNCLHVAFGGKLQAVMTILKIAMVIGLSIVILLFSPSGSVENLQQTSGVGFPGWNAFGAAMLAALWAFDGWNNMPMAAAEIKNPARTIPRALILGMLAVVVTYMTANIAYSYALPFQEVVTSSSDQYPNALPVATKAAATVFGGLGVTILSIAFAFSAVSAMNGSILTSARVPFAMARDGLFFKSLGYVHMKTRVPVLSVVVQGIFSCVLAVSGSFDQLTNYVVFASWVFYALAAASIWVFRYKQPDAALSFRSPGYPWLPAVFVTVSILLLANTVYTSPHESLIGLGIILTGLPVYMFFRRSLAKEEGVQSELPIKG